MNAKTFCAVAAVLALGLAACGEDDDEESAGTGTGTGTQEEQPAPTGAAAETVKLTETEFKIEPARVTVDEAGVVEFNVENAGGITHALEVESEELEEETEDIAAGESATLTVDLPEGTYKLYCPIGDHEDQGMVAELIVGGGGRGGSTEAPSDGDDSGGTEAPSDDNSGGAEAPSSGY